MRRLTVSKVELAMHCLYWLRDDVAHEDVGSEARTQGVALHELAAASINGRAAKTWALAHEGAVALFGSVSDHAHPVPGKRAEVAYAFDPSTGTSRELGIDIDRGYDEAGARPGEVCGSADVVRGTIDGVALDVWDWKTGDYCGSPAKSPQLRSLAMMAAGVAGVSQVTIAYRYTRDGRVESSTLDAFDLEMARAELAELAEDIKPDVQPSVGEHCERLHCPARVACPKYREIAESAAPSIVRHLPVLAADMALDRPEQARRVIEALGALENLAQIMWKRIDAYSDEVGPIDVGNGKAYRGWDETRESISVDERTEYELEQAFGPAYKSAIDRSVSKKSIEDLARKKDPSRGLTGRVELVLASLRTAGSVRQKTIRKHGVK